MDQSHIHYLWIIVMFFYQLFGLSFWRHPFTAEDPLSKPCNAKLLQIVSNEETNSTTLRMALQFSEMFIFRWTITLNNMPLLLLLLLFYVYSQQLFRCSKWQLIFKVLYLNIVYTNF